MYGIFVTYVQLEAHYELYSLYSSEEKALDVLSRLRNENTCEGISYDMEEVHVDCDDYRGEFE